MATSAFLGSQTLLKLGNGASPEIYTTVGEVTNISELAAKKDLIEVTHLLSTAKEYIGGLSDGQEITFECNYVPNNQEQRALDIAAKSASAAKDFRYVLPSTAAGGAATFSFSAIVLSSSIGPTTPNTATKIKFGLKITGSILGPN